MCPNMHNCLASLLFSSKNEVFSVFFYYNSQVFLIIQLAQLGEALPLTVYKVPGSNPAVKNFQEVAIYKKIHGKFGSKMALK